MLSWTDFEGTNVQQASIFSLIKHNKQLLTFIAITLFYFFESAQIAYFNVLAPQFLHAHVYTHHQISMLSAMYYYGNVIGLIPIGFMLDHFQLRKTLLWAILGSVIAAFFLFASNHFLLECIARFFCGFFGGAFSFVGGIRIIFLLFPRRFTTYMGLFLAAGMLGGLICQYPLLIVSKHFGTNYAMLCMALFGLIVMGFNLVYLSPIDAPTNHKRGSLGSYLINTFKSFYGITHNIKNWLNCFAVIFLDTPVSILGTLWGVVIISTVYHLPNTTSALVITMLFVGLIFGSPFWGLVSDRYNHARWIVQIGSATSLMCLLLISFLNLKSTYCIAALFFLLGFFSACQTVVFTWLTKDMREDKIATNSAFNSIIFMFAGGSLKQISSYLLTIPPIHLCNISINNALLLMGVLMGSILIFLFLQDFGIAISKNLFRKIKNEITLS